MDPKLFIVENYHNMSNKKIIKELNISERKFYELIKQLGLRKESLIKGQKIDDMDINQFIIDNYSDMKNEDIIKIVNVNQTYLSRFAKKNNLKKSVSYIKKIRTQRNKSVGRDLTYELLKSIAAKYKTRATFQHCDGSAYTTARKMKILDDICSHMAPNAYSLPQLICKEIFNKLLNSECIYNDREVISPFEIDLFYIDYNFAVEYNGKGWHSKKESIDRDLLKYKKCEEKGIYLFTINEKNRKYEVDIKNQIISNINIINQNLNKNFTENDILKIEIKYDFSENLLNKQDIFEITNKYNSFSDFIKKENKLYNKLLRLKKVDFFTSHMSKKVKKRSIEEVKIEISKFTHLNDLLTTSKWCYIWVKKRKLNYLLNGLLYKNGKSFGEKD
jgi:hypothetical protein